MPQLKVLYIGDIMGQPGRETVRQVLPKLRAQYRVDLVVAQAENVSHGKGMTTAHMHDLQAIGVDFFTGGNHTLERPAITELLADPSQPVIAPANLAQVQPGWGAKSIVTAKGSVLVVSLQGTTFPANTQLANPLQTIDHILASTASKPYIARIVNLHSDYSSEKRIIGYYLDGRVSAVIGDHWHVPTADAIVLPKGTAHITDVGMCGTLHSSLGVSMDIAISRWRDATRLKNEISQTGPYQFNAVLVTVALKTGLAVSIQQIQKTIKTLG